MQLLYTMAYTSAHAQKHKIHPQNKTNTKLLKLEIVKFQNVISARIPTNLVDCVLNT